MVSADQGGRRALAGWLDERLAADDGVVVDCGTSKTNLRRHVCSARCALLTRFSLRTVFLSSSSVIRVVSLRGPMSSIVVVQAVPSGLARREREPVVHRASSSTSVRRPGTGIYIDDMHVVV